MYDELVPGEFHRTGRTRQDEDIGAISHSGKSTGLQGGGADIVIGQCPEHLAESIQDLVQQWLNGFVGIFSDGILGQLGLQGNLVGVLGAVTVLACEWYLCYWLFKRKIFIKI